jgi:predicted acetyltransferase
MIEVRPVKTTDEIETFHQRALEVYQPDADMDVALPRRLADLGTMPDLPPSGQRAAFIDSEIDNDIVGGYTIFERNLRMGPSLLRTGCIGAVYTNHAFRKQGVASALMRDAIEYAIENDYALLLLDGIPGFYDKFGYVDMHDVTHFTMDIATLRNLETGDWQMKTATEDDAGTLLDLYQRNFDDYVGSFERSLEIQQFKLRTAPPSRFFVLALDPTGRPKGYITLRSSNRRWSAEVVAESWKAAKVLLKYHAEFVDADEKPSNDVDWALPPSSDLATMLVDRLSVVETKECVYTGGWMARAGNMDALLQSLLPVWNQRLAVGEKNWTGHIDLHVDDRCWQLQIDQCCINIVSAPSVGASQMLRLTQQQLVQICFNYPSTLYAAREAIAVLSVPAAQAVSVLFAGKPTWIAGTDFF